MKVNKFIKSKIERDYFFVTGKINIDTKYFINQIEQGIQKEDNQSFQTNLMSEMTNYKYFLNDKKFIEMIIEFSDMIEENNFNYGDPWQLSDAWGYKHTIGNYTKNHHHIPCSVSGAIMLNKHTQSLYFPDIDEKIECDAGNFVLFSSFLKHGNKRNKSYKPRYGLSFNYDYNYRGKNER